MNSILSAPMHKLLMTLHKLLNELPNRTTKRVEAIGYYKARYFLSHIRPPALSKVKITPFMGRTNRL